MVRANRFAQIFRCECAGVANMCLCVLWGSFSCGREGHKQSPRNSWDNHAKIENAPSCYRAPRRPDPEFPRKIPKKYPPARRSGLQNLPPKYPENNENKRKTNKTPKMPVLGIFFGIFGMFAWGSRISAQRVFFSIFGGKSGSGHLGAL